jgi:hypothetical protein
MNPAGGGGTPGTAPPLPLDWPPTRVWREQVAVRAAELGSLATWMSSAPPAGSPPGAAALDAAIQGHLTTAVDAAKGRSVRPAARGARVERAFTHLDAAETELLRRAPDAYLLGQLPALLSYVRAHLPPSHPERVHTQDVAEALMRPAVPPPTPPGPPAPPAPPSPATPPALTPDVRESLVTAFATASAAARREQHRLRSFRNIVVLTMVALFILAGGIAIIGAISPSTLALCFAPQGLQKVVCPTQENPLSDAAANTGSTGTVGTDVDTVVADTAEPHDIALVMLVGLAGAAVTGAAALRKVRGTSSPFAVPVALITLKLPTGALTAVLGLLLLRGGFVPGLSALDSTGQIIAWALIFGAAQQLVTGVVDRQAQTVLESVGPNPMTKETE